MTPTEIDQMRKEIRAAIVEISKDLEARLLRQQHEIQRLKDVDKAHRELGRGIRESQSEIVERVDDRVEAMQRRDGQIVGALQEIRDRMDRQHTAGLVVVEEHGLKSSVPAGPVAATAALAADAHSLSARRAAIGSVIVMLVQSAALGLWHAYQAIQAAGLRHP